MITAIDTNILLDVLVPNEDFYEASANGLQEAAGEGSLLISDIVYAELCIHFEIQRECDAFLEANEIRVQSMTREAHFHASRAWRTYPAGWKATPDSCGLFDRRSRPKAGNAPAFAGSRILPQTVSIA